VPPARPVAPARTVAPVVPDHQARPDSPESHRRRSASRSLLLLADHARKAKPESPDPKDHPATPVHKAHPATQAKMVNQAAQARKVPPARPATPAVTDHEATPAHPLSALQVPQETPAQLAPMDHPAPADNQDPKETMVLPVPQDPKARPAHLVNPARMARLATRDHPAPMDPRESPVFAPSTAPWMAASSSRTAHDDKPEANHAQLVPKVGHQWIRRMFVFTPDPSYFFSSTFFVSSNHHHLLQEKATDSSGNHLMDTMAIFCFLFSLVSFRNSNDAISFCFVTHFLKVINELI